MQFDGSSVGGSPYIFFFLTLHHFSDRLTETEDKRKSAEFVEILRFP